MKKILLWLAILPLFTNQVFAQEKEKVEEKNPVKTEIPINIELGTGYQEVLRYSFFNPPHSKTDTVQGYHLSAMFVQPDKNWIGLVFFATPDNQKLITLNASGKTSILSVGIVETEAQIFYSYYKGTRTVFKDSRLDMTGRTIKHYGLLALGGGLGKDSKTNFRILYFAGSAYVVSDLLIYIDRKVINTGNTLFAGDHLFTHGPGISVFMVPVSKMNARISVKYLYSDTEVLSNIQGVIPEQQVAVEGEIKLFPSKMFGLFIKGSYTDNIREMSIADNNVAMGMIVKF